jgi:TRAP-type mannitol/chloroaromatic compound transport system permease small subunit
MEWHLHAALFLLALGYAYLKNSHVRIEVIRESFSTKLKAILEVIGVLIFILPYTGLIVWFGIDFVSRSYGMNEVSAALTGLSHRWIMKSFVPMGMAFLWLAGISVLLRNLSYLIGHKNNNKELMDTSQSMSPELANATEELIKEVKAEEKK